MRRHLSERHKQMAECSEREREILDTIAKAPTAEQKKTALDELVGIHSLQDVLQKGEHFCPCSLCKKHVEPEALVCVPVADGIAVNFPDGPPLFKDFPPGHKVSFYLCLPCAIVLEVITEDEIARHKARQADAF